MSSFRFAIDRGGTFTDVWAEFSTESGTGFKVLKLLSEAPDAYPDAPREGIRRILEEVTGGKYPIDQPLDSKRIEIIRMGTTVATNALLERKGARIAFVTTRGFRDLLEIGDQSR
jgi:5-oxoprolinase (ATP-hydrolysing)